MKYGLKTLMVSLLLFNLPFIVFPQPYLPEPAIGPERTDSGQNQLRLNNGINLYSQGRWRQAVSELRRLEAEAPSREMRAEALFWISLSELSAGEYSESLKDMNSLAAIDPSNYRIKELNYHRGRLLYYMGRYEEAIMHFKAYDDSLLPANGAVLSQADLSRKAAAYYWTGECLYSMGQLDMAAGYFRYITEVIPESTKYEASVYRLAMIDQKKVENELLVLLQRSHEDSLRNMEEYSRKESAYDQAVNVYQKRIAEMQKDTRLQDLEDLNTGYRNLLELAEERIRSLENSIKETSLNLETTREGAILERLRALKIQAQELDIRIRESQ